MDVQDWAVEGTLAKAEREAVIAALVHCGHCRTAAAARLRISRSTLYRLLVAYQVENLRMKPPAFSARFKPHTNIRVGAPTTKQQRQPCEKSLTKADAVSPAYKVVFEEGVWLLVPA